MKSKKFDLGIDELDTLISYLKSQIEKKDIVVLLQGTLASGKTTLVKHYVASLGYDDKVTSPTFSLQSVYGEDIFHYDVYNKTLEEFISLGLLEEFENEGVHFVEWGDDKLENILKEYGFDCLKISIEKKEDKREYKIGS
ncbi:MAG: tRNA (adenosine(37)-N6)-threonylcarbamoyltransferase complex ATPase subunit type 1 TsaE [Campylobacterota bacterium]|nr:tRNA (adenosine(37)-N6)-threonylcarbamoyltransferase complex ATPase subunit type 1 TsaE [Campylobacterota bacterium]